jgi:nucleoside-diphosphate-sugar epimerase
VRIVVFGASGGTGRQVVAQALEAGHRVTAFVRDPARLPFRRDDLRVVCGDAVQRDLVEEAILGQQAVISCLGHDRYSSHDFQTVWLGHAIEVMRDQLVDRLLFQTGISISDPRDPFSVRRALMDRLVRLLSGPMVRDAERAVALLRNSGLKWTVARCPRLVDTPGSGTPRVGYIKVGLRSALPRSDAAAFLLAQLESEAWLGASPMVLGSTIS